jgi:Tfp pilus assembly protein PilN
MGTLLARSNRVWIAMKSPFDEVTGDSVSRCSEELEKLQQRVSLLRSAKVSRAEPDQVMRAVGQSLPDGVWIVSVRDRVRHVEIEGRAITERDMQTFIARLEKEEAVGHVAVVSSQASSHEVGSLDFRLVADYEASP